MREGSSSELSPIERELAALSGAKRFEKILELFGTQKARENFLITCEKYAEERHRHIVETHSENFSPTGRQYSPPKRSLFHNKIMDTLKQLSLTPKLNPLHEKILREMSDREITAQYMFEYLDQKKGGGYEDDEHDQVGLPKRKEGQSDTAFYHTWGSREE